MKFFYFFLFFVVSRQRRLWQRFYNTLTITNISILFLYLAKEGVFWYKVMGVACSLFFFFFFFSGRSFRILIFTVYNVILYDAFLSLMLFKNSVERKSNKEKKCLSLASFQSTYSLSLSSSLTMILLNVKRLKKKKKKMFAIIYIFLLINFPFSVFSLRAHGIPCSVKITSYTRAQNTL